MYMTEFNINNEHFSNNCDYCLPTVNADDFVTASKLRSDIMGLSGVDIMESDGKTFKGMSRIIEEFVDIWSNL